MTSVTQDSLRLFVDGHPLSLKVAVSPPAPVPISPVVLPEKDSLDEHMMAKRVSSAQANVLQVPKRPRHHKNRDYTHSKIEKTGPLFASLVRMNGGAILERKSRRL